MFYVTDITIELYTWQLKKPDGEAVCAVVFLEKLIRMLLNYTVAPLKDKFC